MQELRLGPGRSPGFVATLHANSDDGYLARFTPGEKSVERIEVLPIAGKGQPAGRAGQPYDAKLFQPFLMEGFQRAATSRGRSQPVRRILHGDGDRRG
jgi:hypothetical protein